jgi:hypothetical protein
MRYKTYSGKTLKGTKREKRKYLFCENNKLTSGCSNSRQFNYNWMEETILKHIDVFPLEDLFNDQKGNSELQAIDDKIATATLKLQKLERDADKAKRFAKEAKTVDEENEWRDDHRKTLAEMKPVHQEIAALNRKKSDIEMALNNHSGFRETLDKLNAELASPDMGIRFSARQKIAVLLQTFISQIRFDQHNNQITVILGNGLLNYRFSTSEPKSAHKKNPMKLIECADLRPQIGPREIGGIDPQAFGIASETTFNKLMKDVEPNLIPLDPAKVRKRLGRAAS